MKRHAIRNEAGFTYVEVLVAAVVALLGIFSVIAAFPQTMSTTTYAGRLSVLNHLGLEKLDELRARGFTDTDLTAGVHPAMANDSQVRKYYPVPGFNEDYSLRWTVTDSTPEANMKEVIVEATYLIRYTILGVPILDPAGRTVTMHTYFTN